MNLPGPPVQRGSTINYGDLLLFSDFMEAVERVSPNMPYEVARNLFDSKGVDGLFELFGICDTGEFIYRFVPPEERIGTVVYVMYRKED